MPDHVVDTNVLLVASAAHPFSPFDDSHVPVQEQLTVLEWLVAFRHDDDRRLVLDDLFSIYQEYRNKLSDQDVGLQVIHEKLQMCRSVAIELDDGGHARVPSTFDSVDPSDRKFLAAALDDVGSISIVNATDSDWIEVEGRLTNAGVVVEHVIENWLRAYAAAKG